VVLAAPDIRSMPKGVAALTPDSGSVPREIFSPGYRTSLPIRPAAWRDWDMSIWPDKASRVLFRPWMPLTMDSCAICEVTWALSMGFRGSWFCSCVTSRVRKRSWVSPIRFLVWALASAEAALEP